MNIKMAESLAGVHTHTHTHTSILDNEIKNNINIKKTDKLSILY